MLPAALTAKATQLCAAGLGLTALPNHAPYPVVVRTGAVLTQQPSNEADAIATVRDLIALGADFDAGPLAINGRDFATFGVTPSSVFDACALARVDDGERADRAAGSATVSSVTALLRQAFGARITDTIRPMNASYGVRYSWHKFGQAVDFVPAGGVHAITREQIRGILGLNGVRIIELLGPGDRGHSTHWHVAFARPGQIIDRLRPVEGDEDWIVNVAAADPQSVPPTAAPESASLAATRPADGAPPQWDVFAAAAWRDTQGRGS